MKKTAVLSLSKTKSLFKPWCTQQEYENLSLLTVKGSPRLIGKLQKAFCGENIIISSSDAHERIFENKCKRVKGASYKTALPVLEKICRQTAAKYNLNIPFGEIYIMASPATACAMTACLYGISRIFTIVSCESPFTNMYDELYFKYGAIIRHLPEFNSNISEDSLIIRYSEDTVPPWAKIPVIDFSEKTLCSNLSVNVEKIFVSGENISGIAKLWGGKSGLAFYELTGEIPDEKAEVDINKTADEIFLLDTNQI